MSTTNIHYVCRTCRKEQTNIASQVPIDTQHLNGKLIADMIYELTDIMLSFDSHLPQWICQECLEELEAAYDFRQKCIESNIILSKTIPSLTETPNDSLLIVKAEVSDPDEIESESDSIYGLVEQSFNVTNEKSSKKTKKLRGPVKQRDKNVAHKRYKTKRSYNEIARDCMVTDGKFFFCSIDKSTGCKYSQVCTKLELGNFIRHCRIQHTEASIQKGLVILDKDETFEPKKMRISKQEKHFNGQRQLITACIKLVAVHNLPVRCFEWDGFRILLLPLIQSLGFKLTSEIVLERTHITVRHLMEQISSEMYDKLVSIKVDSAGYNGKHFLTVSAQFEHNKNMLTRVLGLIQVTKELSAKQLSSRILNILKQYNLSDEQIFALIVGNEADMLAMGGALQKTFADTISDVSQWNVNSCTKADYNEALLDLLSAEMRGRFNVVRSVVCNLHQITTSVVAKHDTHIDQIKRFVKNISDPKYKDFFERNKAQYPPLHCLNQWNVHYDVAQNIIDQENFYIELCLAHPELVLSESDWKFLRDYIDAFLPLHEMIKVAQNNHPLPFSEFYMRWLLAIKVIRDKKDNQFAAPLVESLTRQLVLLKENMVYKASLYLDPRFNYLRSAVFTTEQKEEVLNYIVSIWNRIQNLRPGMAADMPNVTKVKQEDKKDDMDDFLTEMFGGPSERSSKSLIVPLNSSVTPIVHQLKSLELESRQAHTFDVWIHWLLRSETHPELFAVAMVVLSLPSNNVNLERAFGALVLSDRKDGLTEKTLEELLLVRLNRNLFDKVVSSISDWKLAMGL